MKVNKETDTMVLQSTFFYLETNLLLFLRCVYVFYGERLLTQIFVLGLREIFGWNKDIGQFLCYHTAPGIVNKNYII